MKKLAVLFFFVSGIASCKKSEPVSPTLSGSYLGIFTRAVGGSDSSSKVSIHFSGNTFTGTSDHDKFPAICQGTYRLTEDSISFQNMCFFTADFDWTLILSGSYQYRRQGDSLWFVRSWGDFIYEADFYILKKQ